MTDEMNNSNDINDFLKAISTMPSLDEEISKQATAARNARMDKAAHRRKSAEMHQGEVILKLVRLFYFNDDS